MAHVSFKIVPFLLVLACAPASSHSDPLPTKQPLATSPVVVELFTSQGCSSCPPADALFSALGDDSRSSRELIKLSYHVDYWNYIGWKDPFSKEEFSDLQRQYGKKLPKGRVYTPMMVIQGKSHHVGSQKSTVSKSIAKTTYPAGDVTIDLVDLGTTDGSYNIRIDAKTKDKTHRLFVALTYSDLETRVQRGENAGKTLHNDHIVFALDEIVDPWSKSSVTQKLPRLRKSPATLVVFARDSKSMAIVGASKLTPKN